MKGRKGEVKESEGWWERGKEKRRVNKGEKELREKYT